MADRPSSSAAPKPKIFKTRAGIVRKSKAERDEYAKQEAERAAARATAAANANISPAHQPKQSERRGRDNKQKDGQTPLTGGSGVFGAGVGTRSSSTRKKQDAGKSEMLEGQEASLPADNIKVTSTAERLGTNTATANIGTSTDNNKHTTTSSRAVNDEARYMIEPNVDDVPRRDIGQIWISSDDDSVEDEEADVITSKGKMKVTNIKSSRPGGGLRPVRATRVFADRMNSEGAAIRSPQRQFKSTRVVHEDYDLVEDDEGDDMDLDDEQLHQDTSLKQDVLSSPELGRKPGKRSSTRTKDTRTAAETAEEKAERLRIGQDIRKLKAEFVTLPKLAKSAKEGTQVDSGDIDESKDGRLLLLQLPPLVPFLVDGNSATAKSSPIVAVKSDPDAPSATGETQENTATSDSAQSKKQNEAFLIANEPARLPAGRVGRLRVHKSGKVTLDWGGTDMEIRHGTEVDFLQDAVLLQRPQQVSAEDESEQPRQPQVGKTYALGQVKRKLVAIPDWQKLYD